MRKIVTLAVIVSILLLGSMFLAPASAAPPSIQRPMEIIEATIEGGDPQTIDPAFCYDTASGELLMNVYDTLVFLDGEHMDRYLPQLATEWAIQNTTEAGLPTVSPEGLPWYFRYTFKIRENVPWQDSQFGTLSTEDVEYCIERGMAMDMAGGPQWMFFEPLLNGAMATYIDGVEYNLSITEDAIKVGKMIDHAVESNATHVWFNLAFPGAYAPFMQILTQSWSSIYSKEWALSLGRAIWDGTWGDYTGWVAFWDPALPPLDDPTAVAMGTGPWVLEALDRTLKQWSASRFTNYWRGWPADWPKMAGSQPKGYLQHYVVTWAFDWPARSTKFLNGEVDYCAVPRENLAEILGKPGIRCITPLPSLAVDALFYNYNIDPTSPYGPINDYGVFNENGIPRDFFSNVNIRKAFSSCIDFATFIQSSYLGEAMQPATALIPGLPYYDATVQKYTYDLAKAKTFFEAVPGLMSTGFTITAVYNSGNKPRENLCNLLKTAVESISPKFHVTVATAAWSAFLYARDHAQLTAFTLGWLADYPDAHNFAYAFYYSYGNFAWRASYSNPEMDALIEAGIRTPDGPDRAKIYLDIQKLVIEDCPSVALDQAIGRHFERDWIVGWYYNPIYAGNYPYNTWKWYYVPHALVDSTVAPMSTSQPCDVNYDGKVNIIDVTVVAGSFGSSFGPPMHTRWVFRADIDNNRVVNIVDIAAVAKYFTKTSAAWTAPA